MFRSICVLLAVSSLVTATAQSATTDDSVGPISLTDSAGNELVMRNYDERPATAVVFLSSRCAATERMIDSISRLYEKYRLRNVLYAGVCSGDEETADELQRFAHRRGVIFSIYRDPRVTLPNDWESPRLRKSACWTARDGWLSRRPRSRRRSRGT